MGYADEDKKQEKERKKINREIAKLRYKAARLVRTNIKEDKEKDEKEAIRLIKTYMKMLRKKACDVIEFLSHPNMHIEEEVIEAAIRRLEKKKRLTENQRRQLGRIQLFIIKRIEAKKQALESGESQEEDF